MTPDETAAALKDLVGGYGFAWMSDAGIRARGKAELGLRGRALYHLGRGGAMGDVGVEVVVAAEAFFPAEVGEDVDVDGVRATFVSMGNPHAVVPVPSVAALGELTTTRLDLNVEYVEDLGPAEIAMRVHERGVGETRSCGTGACAAVVATALRTGTARGTAYDVHVPGGRLVVTWREDGHVVLAGPAVLLAEGVVHL